MKRPLLVLLGLLLFGVARLPFEREMDREYKAAHFLGMGLNRDVREQAGQMGFIAALSGLRSTVADYLWLQVFTAFQHTEWGKMKILLDACTRLQPRSVMFWDMAAWHMAWNASVSAMEDPNQRQALRMRASEEYIRVGEDFAIRGTEFNPDRGKLWERLGDLYRDRMKDHCKAAWAYAEATKCADVMGYVHRFAVYQLGLCPGHEREAYQQARALFDRGPRERTVSLLLLIDRMQKELNVPAAERIDITKDLEEARPRVRR